MVDIEVNESFLADKEAVDHSGDVLTDTNLQPKTSATIDAVLPDAEAPALGDLELRFDTIMAVFEEKQEVDLDTVENQIEQCLHTSWIDWNVQEQKLMDVLLDVPDHQIQTLMERFGGTEGFIDRLEESRAFKAHELSILKHKVNNAVHQTFDPELAASALYDAATDQSGWDAGTAHNVAQIIQDLDSDELSQVVRVLHERGQQNALSHTGRLERALDNTLNLLEVAYPKLSPNALPFHALLDMPQEKMEEGLTKFGGADKFLEALTATGEYEDHELMIIAHKVKNEIADSFDATIAAKAIVASATDDRGWDLGASRLVNLIAGLSDDELREVISILDDSGIDLAKRMRDHGTGDIPGIRPFLEHYFDISGRLLLGKEKGKRHLPIDGPKRLEVFERIAQVAPDHMSVYAEQVKRSIAGISTLDKAVIEMDLLYVDEVTEEQLAGSLFSMDIWEVSQAYGPDFPRDLFNKFSEYKDYQALFFEDLYGRNAESVLALHTALIEQDSASFVEHWSAIEPERRAEVRKDLEHAFRTDYGGDLVAGISKYFGKPSFLDRFETHWNAGLSTRIAWGKLIHLVEPELLGAPEHVSSLNADGYEALRNKIQQVGVQRTLKHAMEGPA